MYYLKLDWHLRMSSIEQLINQPIISSFSLVQVFFLLFRKSKIIHKLCIISKLLKTAEKIYNNIVLLYRLKHNNFNFSLTRRSDRKHMIAILCFCDTFLCCSNKYFISSIQKNTKYIINLVYEIFVACDRSNN